MFDRLVRCIFLLCLALTACQQREDAYEAKPAGKASAIAVRILTQPMAVDLHEVDSQAIPGMLPHKGKTLVLLANDPFLQPVPQAVRSEFSAALARNDQEFNRRLGRVADPLLAPRMLTGAILEARLFERIVWVIPSLNAEEKIDPEGIKGLIETVGMKGSETLRLKEDGTISGEVAGIDFEVVHPAALPAITEPVVLHLDLGYFAAIYKNEVKTPLLPLVGSTLTRLREAKWPVSTVSLSLSNHTGQVPLTMRGLGQICRKLFAEPQRLDQPLPESWEALGKVLYMENFFQNDDIMRLLTRIDAKNTGEPWVKYYLYRFSRQTLQFELAERYLAMAVKGDPGYGLEYMALAVAARERGKADQILYYLRQLNAAFPDDPLFQLSLCEELMAQKKYAEAKTILPSLLSLPWSSVYYPEIIPTLKKWNSTLVSKG